jgi:hypothetical protein
MKPYQHLNIESTLVLDDLQLDSSMMQECYPKFKLYVRSNRNAGYILWSETLPELRALGLEGNINFYGYGSDAQVDFTPADVELLYEYYFNEDAGNSIIYLRTAALMPGSSIAGPQTRIEDLPSTDWEIKLVSRQKVFDCESSRIIKSDLTVAGEVRPAQSYQVLAAGTAPVNKPIPARKVQPSVAGCPLEVSVNVLNSAGMWETLQDNHFLKQNLDLESMTVDLEITQEDFIYDIVPTYEPELATQGFIPDSVWLQI